VLSHTLRDNKSINNEYFQISKWRLQFKCHEPLMIIYKSVFNLCQSKSDAVLYQLILKPFSKFEPNWDGSLSDLYLRAPSSNWLRCLHIFSYKPDHQFGHNMVGITCLFSGIISISRWPLGQLLDWHVHLFFSLITEQIWYERHMIAFSIFWHIWHLSR
jgi:hypothetical protein